MSFTRASGRRCATASASRASPRRRTTVGSPWRSSIWYSMASRMTAKAPCRSRGRRASFVSSASIQATASWSYPSGTYRFIGRFIGRVLLPAGELRHGGWRGPAAKDRQDPVRIGGAEQVGHEVRETAVVALRGPAHAGDDLVVVSGQDAAVAGGDLAADDAGAGLAFALVVGRAEAVDLEEGEELAFVAAKVLGEAAVLRLVDLPGEKLPGLAAELIDERGTGLSLEVGHDLLGTAGLEQQPLDREREARRAALLDLEEVVASAQEMGVAL